MVTPVLDFAEGHVPTTGDHIFAGIITLFLMLPYLYSIFLYVMQALGLQRITGRRGIHNPWLAWFPCGQDWLLGAVSDHYRYVTGSKRCYLRFLLLFVSLFHWICLLLASVFTWALPLELMNLLYSDTLRTFLHTPLIARTILPLTYCLVILLRLIRLLPIFRLYQSSIPRYRFSLLILNIVVPFSPAITIFAVRDYDHGMPPKHYRIEED